MHRNLTLFQHLALSPGDNVAHAALALARLEYPELDLSKYLEWFERQGERLARPGAATLSVADRIQSLNDFLYRQEGFTPNVQDYYDPRNSYINDVIERRTGIPISLAVTYIELARYLDLDLQGVGFPGHFLVRSVQGPPVYIDAFQSGEVLTQEECARRFTEMGGRGAFADNYLKRATKVEILARMLANLKQIFVRRQRYDRAVDILSWSIAIESEVPAHYRDRGLLLARLNCPEASLKDLQHYLELVPTAMDRRDIQKLLASLRSKKTTVH